LLHHAVYQALLRTRPDLVDMATALHQVELQSVGTVHHAQARRAVQGVLGECGAVCGTRALRSDLKQVLAHGPIRAAGSGVTNQGLEQIHMLDHGVDASERRGTPADDQRHPGQLPEQAVAVLKAPVIPELLAVI
jgi:hypothetical protein